MTTKQIAAEARGGGMNRIFQDENFLEWEAFTSSGRFGYSEAPHLVFNCLTNKRIRPRFIPIPDEDEADAQATLGRLSDAELVDLLRSAKPLEERHAASPRMRPPPTSTSSR